MWERKVLDEVFEGSRVTLFLASTKGLGVVHASNKGAHVPQRLTSHSHEHLPRHHDVVVLPVVVVPGSSHETWHSIDKARRVWEVLIDSIEPRKRL